MYSDQFSCPECFKDVRSRNDKKAQAIINAKKISLQEKKPVAIIDDGTEFITQSFTGAPPPGTIDIIVQV